MRENVEIFVPVLILFIENSNLTSEIYPVFYKPQNIMTQICSNSRFFFIGNEKQTLITKLLLNDPKSMMLSKPDKEIILYFFPRKVTALFEAVECVGSHWSVLVINFNPSIFNQIKTLC